MARTLVAQKQAEDLFVNWILSAHVYSEHEIKLHGQKASSLVWTTMQIPH